MSFLSHASSKPRFMQRNLSIFCNHGNAKIHNESVTMKVPVDVDKMNSIEVNRASGDDAEPASGLIPCKKQASFGPSCVVVMFGIVVAHGSGGSGWTTVECLGSGKGVSHAQVFHVGGPRGMRAVQPSQRFRKRTGRNGRRIGTGVK